VIVWRDHKKGTVCDFSGLGSAWFEFGAAH